MTIGKIIAPVLFSMLLNRQGPASSKTNEYKPGAGQKAISQFYGKYIGNKKDTYILKNNYVEGLYERYELLNYILKNKVIVKEGWEFLLLDLETNLSSFSRLCIIDNKDLEIFNKKITVLEEKIAELKKERTRLFLNNPDYLAQFIYDMYLAYKKR